MLDVVTDLAEDVVVGALADELEPQAASSIPATLSVTSAIRRLGLWEVLISIN
jgi:hypothetical protein